MPCIRGSFPASAYKILHHFSYARISHRFHAWRCQAAVLVAIAIPIFSAQLEKSREATDIANVRSAYATLVADYLTSTEAAAEKTINVPVAQKEANWQSHGNDENYPLEQMKDGAISVVNVPQKITGNYVVKIAANGTITVE